MNEHLVPEWEKELMRLLFGTIGTPADPLFISLESFIRNLLSSHHAHLKERVEKAFELGGHIVDYEGDLRPGWRDIFKKLLE